MIKTNSDVKYIYEMLIAYYSHFSDFEHLEKIFANCLRYLSDEDKKQLLKYDIDEDNLGKVGVAYVIKSITDNSERRKSIFAYSNKMEECILIYFLDDLTDEEKVKYIYKYGRRLANGYCENVVKSFSDINILLDLLNNDDSYFRSYYIKYISDDDLKKYIKNKNKKINIEFFAEVLEYNPKLKELFLEYYSDEDITEYINNIIEKLLNDKWLKYDFFYNTIVKLINLDKEKVLNAIKKYLKYDWFKLKPNGTKGRIYSENDHNYIIIFLYLLLQSNDLLEYSSLEYNDRNYIDKLIYQKNQFNDKSEDYRFETLWKKFKYNFIFMQSESKKTIRSSFNMLFDLNPELAMRDLELLNAIIENNSYFKVSTTEYGDSYFSSKWSEITTMIRGKEYYNKFNHELAHAFHYYITGKKSLDYDLSRFDTKEYLDKLTENLKSYVNNMQIKEKNLFMAEENQEKYHYLMDSVDYSCIPSLTPEFVEGVNIVLGKVTSLADEKFKEGYKALCEKEFKKNLSYNNFGDETGIVENFVDALTGGWLSSDGSKILGRAFRGHGNDEFVDNINRDAELIAIYASLIKSPRKDELLDILINQLGIEKELFDELDRFYREEFTLDNLLVNMKRNGVRR